MDWPLTTFLIFLTFVVGAATILAIAAHYIKKIVKFIFKPITQTRPRRLSRR